MLKLMKYEFRKTMFSKMILLVITAIAELAFLAGVFLDEERALAIGTTGLLFCGMFGILYIGIESLICFYRDLNTKQSYMLFLTPNNSYQILGAKVLENGLSIALTGVCFAGLAALDFSVLFVKADGIQEFLFLLKQFAHIDIDWNESMQMLIVMFLTLVSGWIMTVTTGYLAILLSATFLAGKRLSGLVSFLIFMVLSYILSLITVRVVDIVPNLGEMTRFILLISSTMLLSAGMYFITSWIMEKKLSV